MRPRHTSEIRKKMFKIKPKSRIHVVRDQDHPAGHRLQRAGGRAGGHTVSTYDDGDLWLTVTAHGHSTGSQHGVIGRPDQGPMAEQDDRHGRCKKGVGVVGGWPLGQSCVAAGGGRAANKGFRI